MRRLNAAGARLAALPVVPTLALLVALQLAQGFWFAFNTPHNGWIWKSGGDATEYWTGEWAVAHGIIPQAIISYALPVYYAWVPRVTGTTFFAGAPVIVLIQAIVLVPLALVLFWLVADRLFGRVYAWCATALWVAGPLLLLHGFVPRYHATFDQFFLVPHWFGFTNMADLPSMTAVLACVWLALRWLDDGAGTDAVLGGLVLGLALGLKPSNGFIVPPLIFLVICARRPRQAALWIAGVTPALVALALWKVRGLGNLPLTSSLGPVRSAAGASPVLAVTTSKYLQFDWHHLNEEVKDLREVFWSLRFLEFLLVAGAFGLIRKSPLRGTFVVLWFVSYGIFKGSTPKSDFTNTNWFRLSEPGIPAYILLAVGVAFCLPGVGRRMAARRPALPDALRFDWRRVAVPAFVLGLVPLAVLAYAKPAASMQTVRDNFHVNEAPLSDAFHLQVARAPGGGVRLTWRAPSSGSSRASFEVLRVDDGDGCNHPSSGAAECFLRMDQVNVQRGTTFVDHPPPGRYAYRIGMLGGYQPNVESGDLMLLTREAVSIRVR